MSMENITAFWFRRDLRLHDNAGLYYALKQHTNVLPVFIFDMDILDHLQDRADKRVKFIYAEVCRLQQELQTMGSDLLVMHGRPEQVWENLMSLDKIKAVYTNRDYEPAAIARDERIKEILHKHGIAWHTFKDQCIFERDEILKQDGSPYTVFTPYARKWKEKLNAFYLKPYNNKAYFGNFHQTGPLPIPTFEDLGFKDLDFDYPPQTVSQGLIRHYDKNRDFPALDATSHLSLHFRFGTISIREKAGKARELNDKWLGELIWRDFYMYILAHFPHVVNHSFKPAYDGIEWRNNEAEFDAWCKGLTGYPIVDAGMRELNATGFMHNRVRMITASFLCKHLLIDWRWGEAYFAEKLLDFELASNNGGWQWAAGSGVDAAPYFRIFNPALQTAKFDPDYVYIKKWVPEFGTEAYPKPIVEHAIARERCLSVYKQTLKR